MHSSLEVAVDVLNFPQLLRTVGIRLHHRREESEVLPLLCELRMPFHEHHVRADQCSEIYGRDAGIFRETPQP